MLDHLADPLHDRKTAAKYLGLKNPNTLAVWDSTRRYDLQPIKVGGAVRYRQSVLDQFLLSRTRRALPEKRQAKKTCLHHPLSQTTIRPIPVIPNKAQQIKKIPVLLNPIRPPELVHTNPLN